jgi:hypothetical protein
MPHKAYGVEHQRIRARLLRTHLNLPCPYCGELMLSGQDLDLDHSDPADKLLGKPGDRLAHASCNRSYGNGTRREFKPEHANVAW